MQVSRVKSVLLNLMSQRVQQLTWCWLTCSISLLHSRVVLPPSAFTLMNNTAGRASSTLWHRRSFQWLYMKWLRWSAGHIRVRTCSMCSECVAGWARRWRCVKLTKRSISPTPTQTGSHAHQFCLSGWQRSRSLPSHRQAPTNTHTRCWWRIVFKHTCVSWTNVSHTHTRVYKPALWTGCLADTFPFLILCDRCLQKIHKSSKLRKLKTIYEHIHLLHFDFIIRIN